jgi:hypothetical protein
MISGNPCKKQWSHLASSATTTEQKTRIHQNKSIVTLSTIATTTEREHINPRSKSAWITHAKKRFYFKK